MPAHSSPHVPVINDEQAIIDVMRQLLEDEDAQVSPSVATFSRTLEATRRADAGDIDQAKVDEIKAAIADGSYRVDPEAIADKMLSNAQEIFSRSRG